MLCESVLKKFPSLTRVKNIMESRLCSLYSKYSSFAASEVVDEIDLAKKQLDTARRPNSSSNGALILMALALNKIIGWSSLDKQSRGSLLSQLDATIGLSLDACGIEIFAEFLDQTVLENISYFVLDSMHAPDHGGLCYFLIKVLNCGIFRQKLTAFFLEDQVCEPLTEYLKIWREGMVAGALKSSSVEKQRTILG